VETERKPITIDDEHPLRPLLFRIRPTASQPLINLIVQTNALLISTCSAHGTLSLREGETPNEIPNRLSPSKVEKTMNVEKTMKGESLSWNVSSPPWVVSRSATASLSSLSGSP
jgi:hypothetical protein